MDGHHGNASTAALAAFAIGAVLTAWAVARRQATRQARLAEGVGCSGSPSSWSPAAGARYRRVSVPVLRTPLPPGTPKPNPAGR